MKRLASQHGIETRLTIPDPAVSAPCEAPWLDARPGHERLKLHGLLRESGWHSSAGAVGRLLIGSSVRYERGGIVLWIGAPGKESRRGVRLSERLALPMYSLVAPVMRSGEFEFAGLRLRVWLGVFKPHPSTARLVSSARELCEPAPAQAIDVGSGAGGIAIALARAWPSARVIGIDRSARALACARLNARRSRCRNVSFRFGDLLDGAVPGSAQVIVGNVAWLAPAVYLGYGGSDRTFRGPPTALLDEHADGMGHLRRLILHAVTTLTPGGWIFLQLSQLQRAATCRLLADAGFIVREIAEDMVAGQLPRD